MKTIVGFFCIGFMAFSAHAQQENAALLPRVAYVRNAAVPAQENAAASRPREGKRLWHISLLAIAAAQTADVATSWGKYESNPLLANGRGQFGWKSLAIKPVTSSWLAVEWLPFMKRHRGLAAAVNFTVAGLVGWQAWRNAQIARPQR
jgi:hypothetical protein